MCRRGMHDLYMCRFGKKKKHDFCVYICMCCHPRDLHLCTRLCMRLIIKKGRKAHRSCIFVLCFSDTTTVAARGICMHLAVCRYAYIYICMSLSWALLFFSLQNGYHNIFIYIRQILSNHILDLKNLSHNYR